MNEVPLQSSMSRFAKGLAGLALAFMGMAGTAGQDLELVPDRGPQQVFGGDARPIAVVIRNPRGNAAQFDASTRLFQASSATAAPVADSPWKTLQVLPGQTVVESALIRFPPVDAETPFLVQWLDRTNHVLGTTDVHVYPTNLLRELTVLAGEADDSLGLFDPAAALKPSLASLKVGFVDLAETGFDRFHGRLAIVGPFASREAMSRSLRARVETAGRNGAAVVWLQPPPGPRDKLQPSFYTVPAGTNTIVVAQGSLVVNLDTSPQAQLNLLHLCRVALNPSPPVLPESQPAIQF